MYIKSLEVFAITVKFITLGCKTNLYESEAMAELFRNAGFQITKSKNADVCIINTCTVTGTGAQKSRQQIRRARRENPNSIIAVTGCLAQTDADTILKDTQIDIIIGNKNRNRIVEFVEMALKGDKINEITDILKEKDFEELAVTHGQSRVRANLKIEDGCNNFCTYCIIPYARGPVRSRDLAKIREEAEALGKTGYGEVVLTGIHIGSYGRDLDNGTSLIDVIETVHECSGIERIRLGSLEPVVITEDFVKRIKTLPKVCPQFHMSLQSGCDETLKRMNRHYTTDEFKKAVELLRRNIPDTSITTDVMIGFAGETDEYFEKSYNFCKEIGFMQMHIFPYSIRKGTVAESYTDHVPENVKTLRAHRMLELASDMKKDFYTKYIGKTLSVLTEQKKGNLYHGTTSNYMDVMIEDAENSVGKLIDVEIIDYCDEKLIAKKI